MQIRIRFVHADSQIWRWWTDQKLRVLDDYLAAYCKIFQTNPRAKHFDTIYVDAFAGTGLINQRKAPAARVELFAEFAEQETAEFLNGSASRALQHPFTRYIFIEKAASRIAELEKLRAQSLHKERIGIQKGHANTRLATFVNLTDWRKSGAVVFLDPYGMQVDWETIVKLGRTEAVDLWLLFPLGQRVADWQAVGAFMIERLKTAFCAVAGHPGILLNSRNVPLYLFCFASANPKGAPTALKIAGYLLKGLKS